MLLLLLLLLLLEQLLLLLLLLLLLEQLLLLLLLLEQLLLLLLTLMPAPSLVPASSTCTCASTGRLNSAGVQGMLIYRPLHSQRLGYHLPFYLIIYIRVTDDLIDLGTGDGRAGKD